MHQMTTGRAGQSRSVNTKSGAVGACGVLIPAQSHRGGQSCRARGAKIIDQE